MSKLQLSVAMGDYDRNRALFDGRVQIAHAGARQEFTLSLTEPGTHYCSRIREVLRIYDGVKREVASFQKDVKGLLRVHLRHSVGNQIIVPALPSFLEKHPNIKLDVTLTDTREDLVAQGVDVAVWLGNLEDSSLIARRLTPGMGSLPGAAAYYISFEPPGAAGLTHQEPAGRKSAGPFRQARRIA